MRVRGHNHLGQPVDLPMTRVVVYDELDNPIALCVVLTGRTTHVSRLGDPEFNEMLRILGVSRTVVCADADALLGLSTGDS